MFLRTQPVGTNILNDEDRKPVWQVVSGDDWQLTVRLTVPGHSMPATPDNSRVTVVIAEDRFSATPIWTGRWHDGMEPADPKDHPGLVTIRVPDAITAALRRGSYAFSITVSDGFGRNTTTVMSGTVLVEYEPTSPTHDIPYRSEHGQ